MIFIYYDGQFSHFYSLRNPSECGADAKQIKNIYYDSSTAWLSKEHPKRKPPPIGWGKERTHILGNKGWRRTSTLRKSKQLCHCCSHDSQSSSYSSRPLVPVTLRSLFLSVFCHSLTASVKYRTEVKCSFCPLSLYTASLSRKPRKCCSWRAACRFNLNTYFLNKQMIHHRRSTYRYWSLQCAAQSSMLIHVHNDVLLCFCRLYENQSVRILSFPFPWQKRNRPQ